MPSPVRHDTLQMNANLQQDIPIDVVDQPGSPGNQSSQKDAKIAKAHINSAGIPIVPEV